MRVLLVLHEEQLGGASIAALRTLAPLVEEGLDLHVWCARPSPLHDYLEAAGYQVAGTPRPWRYSLARLREPPGIARRLGHVPSSLRAFNRHLRALAPDLVHANATLSLPEAVVARRAGFPVLFHYHDGGWPGLKGRALRFVAWRAATQVAAISKANAATLGPPRKPVLIVSGPAHDDVPPSSRMRAPGDPLVVATVGVLGMRKGTDLFVEMAQLLHDAPVALTFRLAGGAEDAPSPDWAADIVRRAEAAGIVYTPRVDVEAELPGWDIVVMPSRAEPFGLVVLEAMVAARAIVGADRDGISELLADGAGVLVPGEDAAALAKAVLDLARDPQRRAELGAAAYERAMAEFSTAKAAARLADAYARTMA